MSLLGLQRREESPANLWYFFCLSNLEQISENNQNDVVYAVVQSTRQITVAEMVRRLSRQSEEEDYTRTNHNNFGKVCDKRTTPVPVRCNN